MAPDDYRDEIWNTGAVAWRPTIESIELPGVVVRREFVDAAGRRSERIGQDHPKRIVS